MSPARQVIMFLRTCRQWLGAGGKPVPAEVAQQRADTCRACPHHVTRPWEELFKGVAASAIRQQLEAKGRVGASVEGEDRLHLCNLCGCVLRLKCWVPLEVARENTPDWQNFPEWCWMRSETSHETKS